MQLPPHINEGAAVPASPSSSPGSDAGAKTAAAAAAREKPVKVLPCPRCESMNTKFCYYNNYSVTQPRHFCRQCQRYWTAGGTLRNVPVGGGSRKKNRHHPRPGEPYSQRSPGSSSNPGYSLPPGGHSGQSTSNVGFQQHHDMVAALNLPGLSVQGGQQYVAPYSLDQLCHLSPGVYASIMNKLPHGTESNPSMSNAMFGSGSTGPSSINPGGYFTAAAPLPFQTDHTVKPEFWSPAHQGAFQPSRFESSSSMLLNLGLKADRAAQPAAWDQSGDVKPAASTTGRKGSSPRHGSSIEEEGSTPSNGFTKPGYEEGDTVSSMWHSLHDMDNSQLSVKW